MNYNKCSWILLKPVGFMFSPIFARGTGDQTSEPQHKLESKITPPVSWHGHGRSSSFMENTIKIGGCSIAMLVYRSVGIFGISTKQKNTSKWNAKSPSRLQLFGHESRFSSIEGTYITSITEQNYNVVFVFQKSHEVIVRTAAVHRALWTMPGNFPLKETKKLFHGLCRLCMEPLQHPFFNVFIAQVTVHRYNFWTLWKAWPFIPFLGNESATRQQIGTGNEMTARHQEWWHIFQEIIQQMPGRRSYRQDLPLGHFHKKMPWYFW